MITVWTLNRFTGSNKEVIVSGSAIGFDRSLFQHESSSQYDRSSEEPEFSSELQVVRLKGFKNFNALPSRQTVLGSRKDEGQ